MFRDTRKERDGKSANLNQTQEDFPVSINNEDKNNVGIYIANTNRNSRRTQNFNSYWHPNCEVVMSYYVQVGQK